MLLKPTSILRLTLLGFILVAIPLTAGLLSTVFQVDRLAVQMRKTVHDATQAVAAGRLIATQALNMERSAGQYIVLLDEAILSRYRNQRQQFAREVQRLLALSRDPALSTRLEQLLRREADLYQQLEKPTGQPLGEEKDLAATGHLSALVQPIPFDVTRMIAQASSDMNRQVAQVQRLLLWQAGALIPLALFIAVLFSVLVSRPLRRLGSAIRQLGSGRFDQAIDVDGPQDIRQLGEQLDWLRSQLAALDEQKLQFLHHVSHQLKTPLTAIREGAGLLNDGIPGNLNRAQQEVVQILQENSLQLQDQVESLLNFNLALAQEKLPASEAVDLAALISEVAARHLLPARARNISLETDLQPAVVSGAPEQLRVIIDNLLSNAIKYSASGGRVQIRLRRQNQTVVLDVIDEGMGILPEDSPHLFKPFYQGKSPAQGPVRGTGLGLSIVERYLRLHGGSVQSLDRRQGAHFRVTLPVAADAEQKSCTS